MKKSFFTHLVLVLTLLSALSTKATHNRSGEILYYKIPGAYTYSIVIVKYTNDGQGIADRCVDTIRFGDGTLGVANRIAGALTGCGCPSPNGCGDMLVNDANYKVKKSVYTIIHTYPGPGTYVLWSADPNRTQGVNNIPNSVNFPFYLESMLVIDANDSPNNSPQLPRAPIDRGIVGDCFYHNPCSYDPDGDSLSFAITTCKGYGGQTIVGYSFPPTGSGGTFGLDPKTGLLTWCNPQTQGLFSVAVKILEWRKPHCDSAYRLQGYVTRDFEIMVATGSVITAVTKTLNDTCVVAGDQFVKTFTANLGNSISNFNIQVLGSANSPFSGGSSAVFTPTVLTSSGTGTLSWNTSCVNAQQQPHVIHLVITANVLPTPRTFYRTFKVRLTPPQPKIVSVTTSTNQVTLTWNSVTSCTKLSGYNIYRNLNNSGWSPNACSNGVPPSSGYSLIGTVNAGSPIDTTFTDNDLSWVPVTATGKYIVTAVMADCSESVADTMVTQKLLVGINDLTDDDDHWKIYPNPTNSSFVISSDAIITGIVNVNIISIDGKIMQQQTFSSASELMIDSSALPSGIYLLEWSLNNKTYHRKLIKD